MAFHDIRFPENLSLGASGGPEWRSEIVTLANGYEERNSPWAQSRRRYDAGMGLRSLDDLAEVVAFFEARRGVLYAFRWKDWADWKSAAPLAEITPTDQVIGIGDGRRQSFHLCKAYGSGGAVHSRRIVKPVAQTVRVALGGVELQDPEQVRVDPATGAVWFNEAPARGTEITAGFEFDVPVRFATDHLAVSVSSFQAGEIPHIPVIEVRL